MRYTTVAIMSLACLTASSAFAQTWVDVRIESVREDGIHVSAAILSNDWGLDTDCFPRTACQIVTATVQTPLGDFNYPVGANAAPKFVIPYGETWVLSGYFERSWGYSINGTCQIDCVKRRNATPFTFNALSREDAGYWQITPFRETPDTVYANVVVNSDYWHYDPDFGRCPKFTYQMTTEPCVEGAWLGTEWIPATCTADVATWTRAGTYSADMSFVVAFPKTGSYEVGGTLSICYMDYSCQMGCVFRYYIDLSPIAFNTETLAVQEATWGRIKSFYRGP